VVLANAPSKAVADQRQVVKTRRRNRRRVLTWFASRWRNHQPKRAEKPHSKFSGASRWTALLRGRRLRFEGVNRVQSRINDLFDDMFGRTRAQQSAATGGWYPPVDILESKDSYLIRVELPGMKKEDLKTEVNEGTLTLSGERKFEEPADGVQYHRAERVAGKFSRSFYLPQTVKHDGIRATYRDGILEIQVPKAEEAKPRQIAISLN
jgi:HSP20 family protein